MVLLNEYKLKEIKIEETIQSDYTIDIEGYTGEVEILPLPFLNLQMFPKLRPKYNSEEINVLYIGKEEDNFSTEELRIIIDTHDIGTVNWEVSNRTVPLLISTIKIMKDRPVSLIIKNTNRTYTDEVDKIITDVFGNLIEDSVNNIDTLVCNLSIFINAIENSSSKMIEFMNSNRLNLQLIPDEGPIRNSYPPLEPRNELSVAKLVTLVSGSYPAVYDDIAEAVRSDLWVTDARMMNADVGRDLDVFGKCLQLETITMKGLDEYTITKGGMYVIPGEIYHIFDNDSGPQLVIMSNGKQKIIKIPKNLDVHFLSIQPLPYVEKLNYGNITVINTKNEYIHILLK